MYVSIFSLKYSPQSASLPRSSSLSTFSADSRRFFDSTLPLSAWVSLAYFSSFPSHRTCTYDSHDSVVLPKLPDRRPFSYFHQKKNGMGRREETEKRNAKIQSIYLFLERPSTRKKKSVCAVVVGFQQKINQETQKKSQKILSPQTAQSHTHIYLLHHHI